MGVDWEGILGADGENLADAWESQVSRAIEEMEWLEDSNGNQNHTSKPKYRGVWQKTMETISFNRKWGNYDFSDEECEQLLDCKTITIQTTKKSNGSPMTLSGELAEQTYENNGKTYNFIGFKPDFSKAK